MSELGQRLKERREALGLTIGEVSKETRIKPKFIEALERGDYNSLPGDIFARGFIRNYASFLGLDPEEMLKLYSEEAGVSLPTETITPQAELPLERPSPWPLKNLANFLIPLLIIALVAALGWFAYARYQPTLFSVASPTPSPTFSPTPTLSPTPTWTPAPTPTSTPTPALLTLTLVGLDRSWLEVKVDQVLVFRNFINPGDTLSWSGGTIYVKCGNAGGVKAIVNGEDIGPLGGAGEVLNLEWRAGQVRPFLLTPQPTPTPEVTPGT
jgi:cytoskeletal protein RodZ